MKNIYTIEFENVNKGEEYSSTDYYTSLEEVRNFVHLLVCAGYNEMYDLPEYSDANNLSKAKTFRHQTYRKDGKYFSISKQFNGCIMTHKI